MLRNLLITTATVALMTSGAVAANTDNQSAEKNPNTQEQVRYEPSAESFLASDLLGTSVYTGENDEDRIGEVSNVILSPAGEVEAVVVDVGGFLGIGEKPVAIGYDQAEWSTDEDGRGRLTVSVDKETLDRAAEFDTDSLAADAESSVEMPMDEQADADDATKDTTRLEQRMAAGETDETRERNADAGPEADEMADDQNLAEQRDDPMAPRQNLRERLTAADQQSLKAEEIIGATVYGADDENIGEVGDIILSGKEQIEAYIVEVGGFLGIGEKPVAISASDFELMSDENGSLYIFTPFTADQLEDHPSYDEAGYQENGGSTVLKKNQ